MADKILYQTADSSQQWRIAVSEFRGIEYLSFRKWYESYDEGYLPSNEGFNIPFDHEAVKILVQNLLKFLSEAEIKELLNERKN